MRWELVEAVPVADGRRQDDAVRARTDRNGSRARRHPAACAAKTSRRSLSRVEITGFDLERADELVELGEPVRGRTGRARLHEEIEVPAVDAEVPPGETVATGTGAVGAEVAAGERPRRPDAIDARIEGHAFDRSGLEEEQADVAEPESVAQRRTDRTSFGRERHGCHVQRPAKHAGVPAGRDVGGDPVSRHRAVAAARMARRAKSWEQDRGAQGDSGEPHTLHYGSRTARGPA